MPPAGQRPAPPTSVRCLPAAPGVYRFRGADGAVLYLGRATDLRQRVASYWGDLRGRDHLATMVAKTSAVEAVMCASPHEAAWLERNLLERAMPPWNRALGGQETPVYIQMDTRPATSGLSVVRTAARQ